MQKPAPLGKPELYQHSAVVRLRLRSVNWPIQARPAYVDVIGLGEGFQQLQQRPRIQIIVVIYVAEPSQPTCQESIKFSGHLAGQGRVAVFRRAVGDHKLGPQSLLEAFIQSVSEDERLFPGPGDPRVEQQLHAGVVEGLGRLDRDEDIVQLQLGRPTTCGLSSGVFGTRCGEVGRGAPCIEG